MKLVSSSMYPHNFIAEALGISVGEIPYADVEGTAEYLLDAVTKEQREIIQMRYQDCESITKIASTRGLFPAGVTSKISAAFKKMHKVWNGWVLQYGCEYLENHRIMTEETEITEYLPKNQQLLRDIKNAYLQLANSGSYIEDYEYDSFYGKHLTIMDCIRIVRSGTLTNTSTSKMISLLVSWGFDESDIYGEDYEEKKEWAEHSDLVHIGDDAFPYNLIQDVFGLTGRSHPYGIFSCSELEATCTIYHLLDTLTDRESHVMLMMYRDKMTFEQTAHTLGLISRERIRQIHAKALRKLRHPRRARILKDGYTAYMEKINEEDHERRVHREDLYKEKIKNLENQLSGGKAQDIDESALPMLEREKVMAIPIEDLDLSVRAFNILKRANINIVAEIIAFIKTDDLINLKNMGRHTVQEIYDKLIELDFSIEDLSHDPSYDTSYTEKFRAAREREDAVLKQLEKDRKSKQLLTEQQRAARNAEIDFNTAKAKSAEIATFCYENAVEILATAIRDLRPMEKIVGIVVRTTSVPPQGLPSGVDEPFTAYIRNVSPGMYTNELEKTLIESLNGVYKENFQIGIKHDRSGRTPYIRLHGTRIERDKVSVEHVGFPIYIMEEIRKGGYKTAGELVKALQENLLTDVSDQNKLVMVQYLMDMGYPRDNFFGRGIINECLHAIQADVAESEH